MSGDVTTGAAAARTGADPDDQDVTLAVPLTRKDLETGPAPGGWMESFVEALRDVGGNVRAAHGLARVRDSRTPASLLDVCAAREQSPIFRAAWDDVVQATRERLLFDLGSDRIQLDRLPDGPPKEALLARMERTRQRLVKLAELSAGPRPARCAKSEGSGKSLPQGVPDPSPFFKEPT